MKKQFIRTDKFGRKYQNILCKTNDKGYSKGYIELKGKLYQLNVSSADKGYFVQVTELPNQGNTSM